MDPPKVLHSSLSSSEYKHMDVKKKKRVAIIGAGPSGLAACKHALGKGFRPVVFESGEAVSGVWNRTLSSTKLQTPAAAFRFSDFPWPEEVTTAPEEDFPRHDQVVAYMTAYARRFGVHDCVKFRSKVLAAEYVGSSEREVTAWERWSGNGEAFGDGSGEWHLTVQHFESEDTDVQLMAQPSMAEQNSVSDNIWQQEGTYKNLA